MMMRPVNLTNTNKRVFDALYRLAGERGEATGFKISQESMLPLGLIYEALASPQLSKLVSVAVLGWSLRDNVTVDIYGRIAIDDGRKARNRG